MKSLSLTLILLWLYVGFAFSQVTEIEKAVRSTPGDSLDGWKKGISSFINISQTSLTNWTAGGESSVSVNSLASLFANYRKDKSNWDNSLDVAYGLLWQKNRP